MASTINLLRLLADPTRLRLLLLLEQEELSVAELQQILGMGQSRISSHLAQLKRAGVVEDRRVGKNVYYGANHREQSAQRERVAEITQLLARELPETSRDRTSLKLVLHKRQHNCWRKTRAKSLPSIIPRRWSISGLSSRRNTDSRTSNTGWATLKIRRLRKTASILRS